MFASYILNILQRYVEMPQKGRFCAGFLAEQKIAEVENLKEKL